MIVRNAKYLVAGLTICCLAMSATADEGEKSRAVEKDGVSVTIAVVNRTVFADGQPSLKIRFENTARDYINFYDADACWKWQFVFTKLDAVEGTSKTWRLKFDVIHQGDALAHKQAKPGEACETSIDLANDPPFTFTYIGESERKETAISLRHLQSGKYEVKATVSLEDPFGKGSHHWTGPLTTEAVRFTVVERKLYEAPSKQDLAAYEKAVQPVIKLTQEVGGLWLNGGYPEIKLAKTANPEDVIAAVVNVNKSNLGTKVYRVLLVKRLEEDDGKRFVALISVGKTTKALLCFPVSENQWWSRSYNATVE
jgi:hypothetical protein